MHEQGVIERFRQSREAMAHRDKHLAVEVIEGDHEVNELYLELEQDCIGLQYSEENARVFRRGRMSRSRISSGLVTTRLISPHGRCIWPSPTTNCSTNPGQSGWCACRLSSIAWTAASSPAAGVSALCVSTGQDGHQETSARPGGYSGGRLG
ncbi:MAG: hypothetical protein J07HX5_00828 [halophilic archaeon J07HX5]|nr:MAG: hypothetical protein J07HX5_00828 [halophilic archaeon J07HX5]